jgi:hypothetical protein
MAKKHSNELNMVLDQMKNEIAAEMGIDIGPEQTARNNGAVGGQMVKRLLVIAEDILQLQNENKLQ